MNASKTILSAFIVSAALGASATVSHAETLSKYIEKQQELGELDYDIQKYERLIKVKKAKHDLEMVGQEGRQSAGNQQRSGAMVQGGQLFRPSFTSGDDAAIDSQLQARAEMMEQIEQRQANEQARLAELAVMQNATIIEVFRNRGRGSAYGAVLDVDGRKREVQPGDTISQWRITQISLNEITAKNEKYDGVTRTIKQIR